MRGLSFSLPDAIKVTQLLRLTIFLSAVVLAIEGLGIYIRVCCQIRKFVGNFDT